MFLKEIIPLNVLAEKRSNPGLNPKVNPLMQLEKYADDPTVFIHYSKMSQQKHGKQRSPGGIKMGVNPKNPYDTPVGIFAFNLNAIWNRYLKSRLSAKGAPYAGGYPDIWVFRLRPGKTILPLGEYTEEQLQVDIDKIKQIYFSEDQTQITKPKKKREKIPQKLPKLFYETLLELILKEQRKNSMTRWFDKGGWQEIIEFMEASGLTIHRDTYGHIQLIILPANPETGVSAGQRTWYSFTDFVERSFLKALRKMAIQSRKWVVDDVKDQYGHGHYEQMPYGPTPTQKTAWVKRLKILFGDAKKPEKKAPAYSDKKTPDGKWSFDKIVERGKSTATAKTPGWQFWNITRLLSLNMGAGRSTRQKTTLWTKVLVSLGYDAVYDSKGQGIIYSAEPFQAVFKNSAVIDPIDFIQNKEELGVQARMMVTRLTSDKINWRKYKHELLKFIDGHKSLNLQTYLVHTAIKYLAQVKSNSALATTKLAGDRLLDLIPDLATMAKLGDGTEVQQLGNTFSNDIVSFFNSNITERNDALLSLLDTLFKAGSLTDKFVASKIFSTYRGLDNNGSMLGGYPPERLAATKETLKAFMEMARKYGFSDTVDHVLKSYPALEKILASDA